MSFGLRHYAGEVLYDCTELLVKNADSVNADHEELMTAMSKFTFLQDLFQAGKVVRPGDHVRMWIPLHVLTCKLCN